MYGISYAWHGWVLNDISEMRTGLGLYLSLSGIAYLVIAMGIVLLVHRGLAQGWISMKSAFPFKGMLLGAMVGVVVYVLVFISGFSFASHELHHVALDFIWQLVEQGLGGLMVSLGIIHDLHRRFLETEHAR